MTVVLVAVNVTALALMAPLNSLILAHPGQLICLSCLLTIYVGGILVVGLSLVLAGWWGGEKVAVRVQAVLSVLALVSFVRLVWMTMVSPSWQTLSAVLCVVVLVSAAIGFLRAEKKTVTLVHQFFVILFLYEMFNTGQIILQARELESAIESTHKKEAHVEREAHVASGEEAHHVFWIIFDEFSLLQSLVGGGSDSFDVNVVPNLAKFSRTSTWYSHARTLYATTDQAITALLLGQNDVPDLRQKSLSSFQQNFLLNFNSGNYLSSIAQNMDIFIVGGYLPYCRSFRTVHTGCLDFPEGFADHLSLFRIIWERTIPGMLIVFKGTGGLGKLITQYFDPEFPITRAFDAGQSFDSPTFTYIHERLPHSPYQFKSDGTVKLWTYPAGPSNRLNLGKLKELQQSYREQLTWLDSLFGEFLAQLQARNLYDQSWIVVMSDHGTSFDPHTRGRIFGHEQVDRVPFLIRAPGQTHGVLDRRSVHIAEFFEIFLEQMEQGTQPVSLSHAERS